MRKEAWVSTDEAIGLGGEDNDNLLLEVGKRPGKPSARS